MAPMNASMLSQPMQRLDPQRDKAPGGPVAKAPTSGARNSLDYGLPTEDDIRRARVEDEVLGRIGGFFTALGGGTPHRRNRAGELRQERMQGLQQRMGVKQQDRQEQRQAQTDELAQRRLDAQVARDERRMDLQDRQLQALTGYRQATLDQMAPVRQAQAVSGQARAEQTQLRTGQLRSQQEQEDSADSPLARARRSVVIDRIQALRRTGSEGLSAEMQQRYSDENLQRMTARELGEIVHGLPRVSIRDTRSRAGSAGGGGHGGGGGRSSAGVQAVVAAGRARLQRGVESGRIDQETADQLLEGLDSPNRQVRTEVTAAINSLVGGRGGSGAGAAPEGGTEIIDGVVAHVGEIGANDRNQLRLHLRNQGRMLGSIRRLSDIYRQYGAGGVLSPEARARVQPEMINLMGIVAQVGGMGVINENEVPRIRAALQDPTAAGTQVLGTYLAGVGQWERGMVDEITSDLSSMGVEDDGIQRAIQWAQSGRMPGGSVHHRSGGESQGGEQASGGAQPQQRQAARGRLLDRNGRDVIGFAVPESDPRVQLLMGAGSGYTFQRSQ